MDVALDPYVTIWLWCLMQVSEESLKIGDGSIYSVGFYSENMLLLLFLRLLLFAPNTVKKSVAWKCDN